MSAVSGGTYDAAPSRSNSIISPISNTELPETSAAPAYESVPADAAAQHTNEATMPRAVPPSMFPTRAPPAQNSQGYQQSAGNALQPDSRINSASPDRSGWANGHPPIPGAPISDLTPPMQPAPPYGGYLGPQLRRASRGSGMDYTNEPPGAQDNAWADHSSAPANHSPASSNDGSAHMANNQLGAMDVPAVHTPPEPMADPLPPYVLQAMDKDLYRIVLLVEHKRTLVSHLNQMCKALKIGSWGVKKVKQEKLISLARRLRAEAQIVELRNMRRIVDEEGPTELRPLEATQTSSPSGDAAVARLSTNSPSAAVQRRATSSLYGRHGGDLRHHHHYHNTAQQAALGQYNQPAYASAVNPLVGNGPAVDLSFRTSPFYRLGSSLLPPVLFLKPHTRRRVSQAVVLHCEPAILAQEDSHVFLVCQEWNPRAGDQQPIYFPFYNEIELDGEVLNVNTRGIRGVVGSARPVELKEHFKKTKNNHHKLKISITISDQGEKISDKSFAYGVYYGYKVPHEELLEQIKSRPHIELGRTKRMAMQAASGDDGDDFVMSSDAIYSLKDNVMMTRIRVPIRSRACTHIECFDAPTFLMLQDQAETWKCPICNRTITWESLAVDDFFSEILTTAGPEVDTVSIKADGTWVVEDTDSTDDEDSDSDDDQKPAFKRSRSELEDEIVELLSETDDETPVREGDGAAANGGAQTSSANANGGSQPRGTQSAESGEQTSGTAYSSGPPPAKRVASNPPESTTITTTSNGNGNGHAESHDTSNGDPDATTFLPFGGSPSTPDVARHEIYAQILAFQKSANLMFDKPLRVASDYIVPRRQSADNVMNTHENQGSPGSPQRGSFASRNTMNGRQSSEPNLAVALPQSVPPSAMGLPLPADSSQHRHPALARILAGDDDDENEDGGGDVIDLTGDD